MHTTINRHTPKRWEHVINDDGMAWTPEYPKGDFRGKKYRACIPDERLDHMSFECFGYHQAWADTIEELIEDIKSFDVPYYSESKFLQNLKEKDEKNKINDRQVELFWDGRGTSVKRGSYNINNMTSYTSL